MPYNIQSEVAYSTNAQTTCIATSNQRWHTLQTHKPHALQHPIRGGIFYEHINHMQGTTGNYIKQHPIRGGILYKHTNHMPYNIQSEVAYSTNEHTTCLTTTNQRWYTLQTYNHMPYNIQSEVAHSTNTKTTCLTRTNQRWHALQTYKPHARHNWKLYKILLDI